MVRLTAALISALNDGSDLATIETLSVPNRNFDQVAGLDACSRLMRLDISGNHLTNLESISMCTSLKWLSVAGNKLTSLKGVEMLTKLTVLNGSRNAVTSVSEVSSLVNLRALILNNNEITNVTRLDGLINLNTLVLSHNPIRELGKSMNNLIELTKLSVSHCRIQILGASLRRCVALEELRLAHNQLLELPKELEKNGRLRILDLGNNNLQSWPSLQVLKLLHSLSNLNLRGSPICLVDDFAEEVKKLVPTLQILDGHPLVPGRVKRTSGKKTKFIKATADLHKEETRDTGFMKVKSTKSSTPSDEAPVQKASGAVVEDADPTDKSFAELITSQTKRKAATSDVQQDSGVVAVVDGKKDMGGVSRRKRGSEALTELREPEIGSGGLQLGMTPPCSVNIQPPNYHQSLILGGH